jgi:hypothetical protein
MRRVRHFKRGSRNNKSFTEKFKVDFEKKIVNPNDNNIPVKFLGVIVNENKGNLKLKCKYQHNFLSSHDEIKKRGYFCPLCYKENRELLVNIQALKIIVLKYFTKFKIKKKEKNYFVFETNKNNIILKIIPHFYNEGITNFSEYSKKKFIDNRMNSKKIELKIKSFDLQKIIAYIFEKMLFTDKKFKIEDKQGFSEDLKIGWIFKSLKTRTEIIEIDSHYLIIDDDKENEKTITLEKGNKKVQEFLNSN